MLYRTRILDDSGVSRVLSQVDPVLIVNPIKRVDEDKGIDPEWLDEQVDNSLQPELTLSSGRTGYTYKKYNPGQDYDWHQDEITDGAGLRMDMSTTLFLNEPTDYEGGEFAFFNREKVYKFEKGDAILFPSNFMFPHEILPVTSGTRYSIITWYV